MGDIPAHNYSVNSGMVCDCKYEQVDRFIIKVRDFIKKYHASSKVTSPLQMKRDGWDEHGSTPKCRKLHCSHRLDCMFIFCAACDYVGCMFSSEANKRHFTKTGHQLGCCKSRTSSQFVSIYCLKCAVVIDQLVTGWTTVMLLDLNLTLRKRGSDTFTLGDSQQTSSSSHKKQKLLQEERLTPFVYPIVYCRGLFNFGKTCFMNCIIQVLIHLPIVSNFFVNNDKILSEQIELVKRHCDSSGSMVEVFRNLLHEFRERTSNPICPQQLLRFVWEKMPHLGGNMQHDAHEFFISVINQFHLELMRQNGSNVPSESLVDRLFLGRMESEIKCVVCQHSRFTNEPFWDISLEVVTDQPRGVPVPLTDLLQRYTKLEHLDDDNLLHCPCCSKKTLSTKQLRFLALPRVVCVQLKRFRHNPRFAASLSCTKISTKVPLPEHINFDPYLASSSTPELPAPTLGEALSQHSECKGLSNGSNYNLYAVVSHRGTYNSGHYRTFLRKSTYWLSFNDAVVERVSQQQVLQSEGYLLFYRKNHPLFDWNCCQY